MDWSVSDERVVLRSARLVRYSIIAAMTERDLYHESASTERDEVDCSTVSTGSA